LYNFKTQEIAEYVNEYCLTDKELKKSYVNCASLGLERTRHAPSIIHPLSEVRKIRKAQHFYLKAALFNQIDIIKQFPPNFVCFLTDHRLINLYTIAKKETRKQYHQMGLGPGVDFSELSVGTNAISMCSKLRRTVVLFGPQHYLLELYGGIWCVAGEVCLPDGELLWVFGISAPIKNDLCLAVVVTNLVVKQLEQTVAGVWQRQQESVSLCEAAVALAVEPLTTRELDILPHLFMGRSYADIGQLLNLASGTINTYVPRIYKKLQINGRKELWMKLQSNQ
jgi:transcriptional regulator of acetoin/glycerol metabolism